MCGARKVLYQGTTSQLAEKVISANGSYQGATSVVPLSVFESTALAAAGARQKDLFCEGLRQGTTSVVPQSVF
jgi:hypothetical protein